MRRFLSFMLVLMLAFSFALPFATNNTKVVMAQQGAEVKILMPADGTEIKVGDEFYVNAVITNPTDNDISDNAVIDPGLTATLVPGEVASKSVTVPAHGVYDVWWKLKCNSSGYTTITVTFGAASDSVTIHQWEEEPQYPKKVLVEIIEYPQDTITPCTDFVIKVKYTNLTDKDITNFYGKLVIVGPASLKNDPETKPLGTLKAGKYVTSAWNLHCDDKGYVKITATAEGNGLIPQNIITDMVIIDQGQPEPQPPTPDSVTLEVNGPEKVCTQGCGFNIFKITAKICNYWVTGYPIKDVVLTISVDDSTKAQIQPPLVKNLGDIPYNSCNMAVWDVVCIQAGDVEFTVTADYKVWDPVNKVYVDKDDYLASHPGANLATVETWDVSQKDIYVDILDPSSTEVTHYISDKFDVTAKISNCLCYAFTGPLYVDLLQNGEPLPNDVEFDPNNLYAHVVQYDQYGNIVQEFDYAINPNDPDHPGRIIINNLCACCSYVITWHLHCKGESVDEMTVILSNGQGPIDSDAFTLKQEEPPPPTDLTKGIFVFPGWYSDNSLRLTPGKGLVEREEFAVSQNWTAVVVVSNIGNRDAEDVTIDIGMTGDFDDRNGNTGYAWFVDPSTGERELIDFSSGDPITFEVGYLKAGESKKLIFEAHCSGPDDVLIFVPEGGIVGYDPFRHRLIGGDDGGNIYHVPNEKSIYQKPIDIIFMNPKEGESFDVCETFAVKAVIINNDPEQDLMEPTVTLHWEGNAELAQGETNPRTLVSIPHKSSREVAWNIHCTGEGDVKFWLELKFSNTDLYINEEDFELGTFEFRTIHQIPPPPKPELEVEILSPTGYSIYATGQTFAVTAKISNSVAIAKNVVVSIEGDSVVVDESSENPKDVTLGDMNPDEYRVVTWTMRCTNANGSDTKDKITVKAKGDNADEASDYIEVWQYPAAYLKVEITEYPKEPIETCSYFHVRGKVWNLGYADATEVKVTLSVTPDGSVRPVAGNNGYVINLGTIPGTHGVIKAQYKEFDFYLHCKVACESTLTITPSGKDEYGWSAHIEFLVSELEEYEWDWHEWLDDGWLWPLSPIPNSGMGDCIEEDTVTVKQIEPQVTQYIRTTYPYDDSVFGTTDIIPVTWTVKGFEDAPDARIRILFYNGDVWYVITGNLPVESGSFNLDLSGFEIVDPLRCRVRVGVYTPSSPGSFGGPWYNDGAHQYYDETGHFWVTDNPPSKYIKTTSPDGNMIFKDNDTISVNWDVEGFEGVNAKIRILFYNGKKWYVVAYNLPLQDGSYSLNLSTQTIGDFLRARIRVGVYIPDSPGSKSGPWYTEGDQQFYDETGHFWALP